MERKMDNKLYHGLLTIRDFLNQLNLTSKAQDSFQWNVARRP